MNAVKLALVLLSAVTGSVHAQPTETYLCVSDDSAGFHLDETSKKWKNTRFRVDGERFLVTSKSGKWAWNTFGKEELFSECGAMTEAGYLHCTTLFTTIIFNKRNLRFQSYFRGSYVTEGIGAGSDTPNITIGTCTRM